MLDLFAAIEEPRHDAGGRSRFQLQPDVRGAAEFGGERDCWRFWLSRKWGAEDAPFALWLGTNPSTAEANVDDPTIRREIGFTRRAGLTSYVKMNVIPYRATNPKALLGAGLQLGCGENPAHIRRVVESGEAALIVAAWGALPKPLRGFVDCVTTVLAGRPLWCLGTTADGSPRHPLYVRGNALLVPWGRLG